MKEKGFNYWPSSSPLIHWRFGILSAIVLLGMVVVWSIDGCTLKTFLQSWNSQQDFVTKVSSVSTANFSIINNNNNNDLTQQFNASFAPNPSESLESIDTQQLLITQNNNNTNNSDSSIEEEKSSLVNWVKADLEPNVTTNLISRWLTPGGEPCKDSKTVEISIPGLDNKGLIELHAGKAHEFVFHALDSNKTRRCLGGDYFETDLSSDSWKSRPLVKDFGNGSYSLTLQVHPDFVGTYNLTVTLLYRHFEGLRFSPSRFVFDAKLREFHVEFVNGSVRLPENELCKVSDFDRDLWSGRWARLAKNEACSIGNDGRFRCLAPDFPCSGHWCEGPLGSLESNGWVYSAHCSFRIFKPDPAWDCLKNRWIFFWGDSNHVDTIRNILNFVLDRPDVASVPRRFDMNFTDPRDPTRSVRITSIFNGHWNETMNYQGLNSLQNEEFRNLVKKYFSGDSVPDTVILNSGLHDGIFWRTVRSFAKGADFASAFWAEILGSVRARGLDPPRVVYRSTIATAGYARSMAFNPSKMEVFNWVFLESLKKLGVVSGVIDDFDLTFPWHYDNRCNDGVHYGRAPAKMKWRDGQIGHQYFVDLMLAHVLLNALCPLR